jgi:hypothetical protein
MIFSLLIYILFYEKGVRGGCGNLTWQAIICSFILLLASTVKAYSDLIRFRQFPRLNIYQVLFGLHFLCGVFYIARMFVYRIYI